ncbi:hypothetical protein [Nocardia sputi]|uniref:hypothetical protein n=1 Tax=Nocardia sputi TaxID=2943705 RepID=UPI0020C08BE5|nr:hypothetical protein [Nocardia sputi]
MEHTTPSDCDTDSAASSARLDRVGARVPQGYKLNVRIRFGARQGALKHLTDVSRHAQGGTATAAAGTGLPKALASKIEESDRKIVNWLAKNAANRQLFITQPVDALVAAGVDLTRFERKLLQRIHRAAGETNVLPPGAELAEVAVTTAKNRGNKTGRD